MVSLRHREEVLLSGRHTWSAANAIEGRKAIDNVKFKYVAFNCHIAVIARSSQECNCHGCEVTLETSHNYRFTVHIALALLKCSLRSSASTQSPTQSPTAATALFYHGFHCSTYFAIVYVPAVIRISSTEALGLFSFIHVLSSFNTPVARLTCYALVIVRAR
jgi:hypothetical protein